MYYTWNSGRAEDHIDQLCKEVENVEIVTYKRSLDLGKIPVNKAYEMDAVHLYVDILNLNKILADTEGSETESSHKKALRFFDSHFRAIRFILEKTDAIFVDFHNQRLHAVIPRPYGDNKDEKKRLDRCVAISELIIRVVEEQRSFNGDDAIPAAKIRIGIDTGVALAVNNGRRSEREPLFLGNPANHAAKHVYGKTKGIYLTSNSRNILELVTVEDTKNTSLTTDEINSSVKRAKIEKDVTSDQVIEELRHNNKLLKDFSFSRTEPPLKGLDLSSLYYKSAKRQEILSIYADIDGFTDYVSGNLGSVEGKENIIRCLHVLRSELDDCLYKDFSGRRVRFIGDCMHGLICEGSKSHTDYEKTAIVGTEAVSGLRSSFNLSLNKLQENFGIDADSLGLAIGYELGVTSLTRVGKIGSSTRCSLGLSTIASEKEQMLCNEMTETRIGVDAYKNLTSEYQNLFTNRSSTDLTFEQIESLDHQASMKNEPENLYESNKNAATQSRLKAHAIVK